MLLNYDSNLSSDRAWLTTNDSETHQTYLIRAWCTSFYLTLESESESTKDEGSAGAEVDPPAAALVRSWETIEHVVALRNNTRCLNQHQ